MRLLVDTQVWLWMLATPDRLTPEARALVENGATEVLLSAASAWEIAIKVGLGRLALPGPPEDTVPALMVRSAVTPLSVTHRHALRVAALPPHHRDPFDRLLVAQAQIEDLPLLTADPQLRAYDVKIVPA
jgi:PIN domain nuclease of toxin-antitoxin system